ncbi:hypothetical protein OQA88_8418 [Cercophora sp. LCS_1]
MSANDHRTAQAAEARKLAEETDARIRQQINEILQRPPPTPERLEELQEISKRFYDMAMERKRKERRRQLTWVAAFVVAASGACMLTQLLPLGSLAAVAAGITITLDPSTTHQTISGFGFAEAFQRAHSIMNLPPKYRTEVLDLLFNTTTGAGFSILRIGLGSSVDSGGDKMNSPQPSPDKAFVWDKYDSGQVWVAKQAMRYGVETFIADAWSAPGYMKTNGRDDQGGWLCGVRGEGKACEGSWVGAYAEYLAKYVKAWWAEGVKIGWVGFLNEPNLIKGYATMQSDGYQAADVIPALDLALKGSGLDEVKISCCEGQGWSMARDLLDEIQDAGVEGSLGLYTTHTYKGTPPGPDRPLNTTLPVWVTEISPIMDRLGMTQTWYRNHSENEGLRNAINIHEALTTGNVSAYIYWIGSGQSGAEAPFIWAPNPKRNRTVAETWAANPEGTQLDIPEGTVPYTIGSTYWGSAQFSRFIRPGAKRIGFIIEEDGNPAILTSAYRNPDRSVVVQIINNSDEVVPLSLFPGPLVGRDELDAVQVWASDDTRKLTLLGSLANADFVGGALSKRSLTTLVFKES